MRTRCSRHYPASLAAVSFAFALALGAGSGCSEAPRDANGEPTASDGEPDEVAIPVAPTHHPFSTLPSARSFLPLADAKIRSDAPTRNYGASPTLRVRRGTNTYRSYLRFEVKGLTQPVTSASLLLYVADGSPDAGTVFTTGNDWSEETLSWSNAPSPLARLDAPGAAETGSWIEFDVTSAVTGDGVYSFALASQSSNSAYFSSREGSAPPRLVVLTSAPSDPGPGSDGGVSLPPADGGAPIADAKPQNGGLDAGVAPPPADGSSSTPRTDAGGLPPAPPPTGPVLGIWTSAAELKSKPTSGAAWTELLADANGDTSSPNVSNQDDPTNVRVLAAAIVYARTGETKYRDKVVAACQKVIGTEAGGRTLAWGREAGAYAMAADLVGYRTATFEAWLRRVVDEAKCSQLGITLRKMFEKRPNNWGAMGFGSVTAIYRYLGDTTNLKAVRDYWAKSVAGPNPGLDYGELSWQASASDPRTINPKGATKQGVNLDGIIPDDMRRGGSFTTGTPGATNYPWGFLAGTMMGARVLERAGLSIWEVDNRAIYRAAYALQERLKGAFLCQGNDLWQLPLLDRAYGTHWTASAGSNRVWRAGENAGYGYVVQ